LTWQNSYVFIVAYEQRKSLFWGFLQELE